MKIRIQWKDPDAPIVDIQGDVEGEIPDRQKVIRTGDYSRLPEPILNKLQAIGFGEYLVVEFDLDTMTGTVVK